MSSKSLVKIKKTEVNNKFVITHYDLDGNVVKDGVLVIDFNPILNILPKESENFVLAHYQAKPKNLRTWGVYARGNYYSFSNYFANSSSISIKLDEKNLILPPHAVLYYPNSVLKIENDIGIIENA